MNNYVFQKQGTIGQSETKTQFHLASSIAAYDNQPKTKEMILVSSLNKSDPLYTHRKRKNIKITKNLSSSINVVSQNIYFWATVLPRTLSRSETSRPPTTWSTKTKKKLIR